MERHSRALYDVARDALPRVSGGVRWTVGETLKCNVKRAFFIGVEDRQGRVYGRMGRRALGLSGFGCRK